MSLLSSFYVAILSPSSSIVTNPLSSTRRLSGRLNQQSELQRRWAIVCTGNQPSGFIRSRIERAGSDITIYAKSLTVYAQSNGSAILILGLKCLVVQMTENMMIFHGSNGYRRTDNGRGY